MTVLEQPRRSVWTAACRLDDLEPDRGAAVLVDGDQIALFRLRDGSLHAIANHDPFSRANVLSRGIVGTRGDAPKVASPMYKHTFDLRTGQCFEDPAVAVDTYAVRVDGDWVLISRP